jgi:uncharacterized membrane protein YbhN (UPF0104 family)
MNRLKSDQMGRPLRIALCTLAILALAGYGAFKVMHSPEWRNFDWHKLVTAILQIRARELLSAILLMYLTYFLRACRWYEFLRPVKRPNLMKLWVAQVLGFGAVAVLGRPGELVRPYMIARQEDMSVSSQMAVWVLERFYDFVAMILVVGASFVLGGTEGADDLSGQVAPILLRMRRLGVIILIATLVGIVLLVIYERRLRRGDIRLPVLANFAEGLAAVRSARAQILGALYSLGIWITIAAAFWMVLQAFGPPIDDLNLAASMLVMGFAIAGSVIQAPGVGGGSQVFAILALTEIFGVPAELATSAAVVLWALAFVAVVPLAALIALQQGISLGALRSMVRGSERSQTQKGQESIP